MANSGIYLNFLEDPDTGARFDIGDIVQVSDTVQSKVQSVSSIADLKSLDTSIIGETYLSDNSVGHEGRSGFFSFSSSNLSTEVSGDPLEGIYVPPTGDPTGSSGAWVRKVFSSVTPTWWGALADGTSDDSSSLIAAVDSGYDVDLSSNTYAIGNEIHFNGSSPQTLKNGTIVSLGNTNNMVRLFNAGHKVVNVKIDGDGLADTLGINVGSGASGVVIEKCTFVDLARCGIFSDQDDTTVKGSLFDNCGTGAGTVGNFVTSILGNGNRFRAINNRLINCNWGIYSRGADSNNRRFDCEVSGNYIVCKSSVTYPQAQGISAQYNRGMHVTDNTVIGFLFNGIDQQACENSIITGNTCRSCADGVFIGDRGFSGHNISNNTFETCVRGIRYYNTDALPEYRNQLMQTVTITGNTIISATNDGIAVSITGTGTTARHTIISDNIIRCDAASSRAIYINGLSDSSVRGNMIYRPKDEGILLDRCDGVTVTDNTVIDASQLSPGTKDAIRVTSSSQRIFIRNTYVKGNARDAVRLESGGLNHTVSGTRARSINGVVVTNNASSTTLSDNILV